MIIADQIYEALKAGDGESAVSLLNRAYTACTRTHDYWSKRSFEESMDFSEKSEKTLYIWDFLGVELETMEEAAFDSWKELPDLPRGFEHLRGDWDYFFLPCGIIRFVPDPGVEEYFLRPWESPDLDEFYGNRFPQDLAECRRAAALGND